MMMEYHPLEEKQELPSFYAVIPAPVLFDERLKPNEKILYAIISSLARKEGCCWATNRYLGTLLNRNPNFIVSGYISRLEECGHITVRQEIEPTGRKKWSNPNEDEFRTRRYIWIVNERGYNKNIAGDNNENIARNNINLNNTFSKENVRVPDGTQNCSDKVVEESSSMKRTKPSQSKKKESSSMKERILSSAKQKEASPQPEKAKEKLPSIDQMPQYMQTWFSLPYVTKPSIKTYHKCIQLFDQLSKGKFPTKFQNIDKEWVKHNNILNTSLNHKWSEEEFSNVIDVKFRQMVEDKAFWPENKKKMFKGLTMENFIFNSHAGKSWLLMLYSQKKPKQLRSVIDEGTLLHDKHPKLTRMVCEEFDIHENRIQERAQVVRFVAELIEFRNSFPTSDKNSRSVDNEIPKERPKEFFEHIFDFLRHEYDWADPNPSLLNLRNKPLRDYWEKAWSEDHGLPKPPIKYLQEWLRA